MTRLLDLAAYWIVVLTPVWSVRGYRPGRWNLLGRLYWAALPYAGNWAYRRGRPDA